MAQAPAVKMGTVWDRTVEVISGRTGMLASIALLTLWLPTLLRQVIALATVGGTVPGNAAPAPGALGLLFVLSLVTAALTVFGQLALIAAASHPSTTRADAFRIALARLPVAIGLALLLGLVVFVLLIPAMAPIAAAMPNPAGMTPDRMGAAMATIAPGTRAFIGLYALVFLAAMIWLTARLCLLNPVVVNERDGVRSFARSLALTRGLTWKIIGLFVLLGIVSLVVILATQLVTGILFRLLLGAANLGLVALLTGAAVGLVTAAVTVVWTTFVAQLYVARVGVGAGVATAG